jgi:hypothetical protein
MRQEAGWTAAVAVAIAAVVGVTSEHSEKPSGDQGASAQGASQQDRSRPVTGADLYLGPCAQIEDHLKSFLGADDSRSNAAPVSCSGPAKSGATGAANGKNANGQEGPEKNQPASPPIQLKFMIATLPDPAHSHFPLEFDRMSEAIQQGASDEGYVYDSSWLPWVTKDSTYGSLQDQDTADSRQEAQEEQPGILLFRRKSDALPSEIGSDFARLPYQEGLIVFIAGEEPTQGIHRDQFRNATAWIAALQAHDADTHRLRPMILGPSFSGSVYSLAALVTDPEVQQSLAGGVSGDEMLRIYSGNITGNKALTWITNALGTQADFASFRHSDGFLISRYCEYLNRSSFDLSRLAVLSEDQTAYGSEVVGLRADTPGAASKQPNAGQDSTEASDANLASCNLGSSPAYKTGINKDRTGHTPLRVFYPRDISALRAAYQSESIFSSSSSSSSETVRRTLTSDIADPQGDQHDSIRTYSGDQKALSQEAVLQQIVSELRIHQSEYILLRSSNVLDQIFLSHYLRLGYPQGRIVIVGADQLLRRESGAARLSGIMTLTTYPLLPWEPHWTQRLDDPGAHSHRVFAQDISEGVYVATRALLHFPVKLQRGGECKQVVAHLRAAGYTIQPTTGDNGENLNCPCQRSDKISNFELQASQTATSPHLTLAFTRNGDQYQLDAAPVDTGQKNESLDTNKGNGPASPMEITGYPLPFLPLKGFVPVDAELTIPDYRAPFWIDPPGPAQDAQERPVAWLSVLGRNDFWPLAALTIDDKAGETIERESLLDPPQGPFHDVARAFRSLFNAFNPRVYGDTDSKSSCKGRAAGDRAMACPAAASIPRWMPMGLSIRLVLAALLIGCGFHFICCLYPSVTQKPSHRAYFVCVNRRRRPYLALMVLGSVTISATATVVASGFGAMSPDGAPLANPCLWLLSQPFFWSIAGLALAINVSKQPFAPSAGPEAAANAAAALGAAGETGPRKWWSVKRWKRFFKAAKSGDHNWRALWRSTVAFLLATLAFYFIHYLSTERILTVASRVPAYWRSMDLTDGVSPILPPLAICVGAYLWFWYSLQGLALLGRDRPRLPQSKFLTIKVPGPPNIQKLGVISLRMFGSQGAAAPVEELCGPFAPKVLKRAVLFFAAQILLVFLLEFRLPPSTIEVPLRSLGARAYSILICFLMDLLFSTMLANAWQLVNVWRELRKLLTQLDRLPLRRSMAAFPRVSWNSVWTISGNVLDMRYKLLTSELQCVTHLKNCLAARNPLTLPLSRPADEEMNSLIHEIDEERIRFAKWYLDLYNSSDDVDQQPIERVQKLLANFAGFLMTKILAPAWREEKGEQLAGDVAGVGVSSGDKEREELTPVSQLDPYLRHAEHLVGYVYLGFIQNVLGRMRSLVMCILLLFIAATFAMASYPFDPRPTISGAMVLLFGVLTTAIVFVYAQVHRDPILSLVTNTKPGELGGDFWLKLLGFGAGPVLGLLTTLFPQLTDFLFSWVQPSLTSIK